jgi:hypothetical protein
MYSWLWRHLPFGLPGKIAGSLLLAGAVAALLWYQVFPAIEPHLPFNDGQVTQNGDTGPTPAPSSPASPSPDR